MLIPAAAVIAGVTVGGVIQYFVTRRKLNHDKSETRRAERLRAYSGYIDYLRHLFVRIPRMLDREGAALRKALDDFTLDSFSHRTQIAVLASSDVRQFMDERAQRADDALLEAYERIFPKLERKFQAGEFESREALFKEAEAEFNRAWTKIVRPYIRDLLRVMHADLAM